MNYGNGRGVILDVDPKTQGRPALFAAVKAAGFDWIRTSIHWMTVDFSSELSLTRENFNWQELLDDAKDAGLKVLLILQSSAPSRVSPPEQATNLTDGGLNYGLWSEEARVGYAAFAAAAATLIGSDGHGIELWNEPNLAPFWISRPDRARYVEAAGRAAEAAKAANPATLVVVGGVSLMDWPWLEALAADRRIMENADLVAPHPYRDNRSRDEAEPELLRAELGRLDDLLRRSSIRGRRVRAASSEVGYSDFYSMPDLTQTDLASATQLLSSDNPNAWQGFWNRPTITEFTSGAPGGNSAYYKLDTRDSTSNATGLSGIVYPTTDTPDLHNRWLTLEFWAKADRPMSILAGREGGSAEGRGYARRLALTPEWRKYSVTYQFPSVLDNGNQIAALWEDQLGNPAWYLSGLKILSSGLVENADPALSPALPQRREKQARQLTALAQEMASAGVPLWFVYRWDDLTTNVSFVEKSYGVVDSNGNSKPALAALTTATRIPTLNPEEPLGLDATVVLRMNASDVPNLGRSGGRFRSGEGSEDALRLFRLMSVRHNRTMPPPGSVGSVFARLKIEAIVTASNAYISSVYGYEENGDSWQLRIGEGSASQSHQPSFLGHTAGWTVPLGQWFDLLATCDGSNVRYYLNGVPFGAVLPFVGNNTGTTERVFHVGSIKPYDRPFQGLISHVYAWHDRALTALDAARLHADPNSLLA